MMVETRWRLEKKVESTWKDDMQVEYVYLPAKEDMRTKAILLIICSDPYEDLKKFGLDEDFFHEFIVDVRKEE